MGKSQIRSKSIKYWKDWVGKGIEVALIYNMATILIQLFIGFVIGQSLYDFFDVFVFGERYNWKGTLKILFWQAMTLLSVYLVV